MGAEVRTGVVALLLVVGAAVLVAGCMPSASSTPTPAQTGLPSATLSLISTPVTAENIRERLAEAWNRPGMALHVRVMDDAGQFLLRECWLDLANRRGRIDEWVAHTTKPGVNMVDGELAATAAPQDNGSVTYTEFPLTSWVTRFDTLPPEWMNPALLMLPPLSDAFYAEWKFLREETWESRPATVWEVKGPDPRMASNRAVWIDAETLLPLAYYAGEHAKLLFVTEWAPIESLPASRLSIAALREEVSGGMK